MRINHQTNTINQTEITTGGDATLTGSLSVSGTVQCSDPTQGNHATTRDFVLDNIDYGEIYINESGRITADSFTLSGGVTEPVSSGNLADTYTINGSYLTITEGDGTPGFDLTFTFAGMSSNPNKINLLGRYNGTVAHDVEVQLWNWVHTRWDELLAASKDIPHTTADDVLYTFIVTEELSAASDYLGTGGDAGKTIVRINHSNSGTITDVLRIDYLDIVEESISLVDAGTYYTLTSGVTGGQTNTSTTSATGGAIIFGHTGRYFVTNSSSFLGTGSAVIEGGVYVNDVQQPNIRFTRNINSTGDVGSASCQGFVTVTTGDIMQFKFSSNTSNSWVSVEHFNLTCNYRGA